MVKGLAGRPGPLSAGEIIPVAVVLRWGWGGIICYVTFRTSRGSVDPQSRKGPKTGTNGPGRSARAPGSGPEKISPGRGFFP